MQTALALRDRGATSPPGFAAARGRLFAQTLLVLAAIRSPAPDVCASRHI
ncbi:MAG: hypothetical protein AB7H93_20295 [Vicinamibacterales bacterium]